MGYFSLAAAAYKSLLDEPGGLLKLVAKALLLAIAAQILLVLLTAALASTDALALGPLLFFALDHVLVSALVWAAAVPVLIGRSVQMLGADRSAIRRKPSMVEILFIWLTVPAIVGIASLLIWAILASCVGVSVTATSSLLRALALIERCEGIPNPEDPLVGGVIGAASFSLPVPWLAAIPLIAVDAPYPYAAARVTLRNRRLWFTGNLLAGLLPVYVLFLLIEYSSLSGLALPVYAIGSSLVVANVASVLYVTTGASVTAKDCVTPAEAPAPPPAP